MQNVLFLTFLCFLSFLFHTRAVNWRRRLARAVDPHPLSTSQNKQSITTFKSSCSTCNYNLHQKHIRTDFLLFNLISQLSVCINLHSTDMLPTCWLNWRPRRPNRKRSEPDFNKQMSPQKWWASRKSNYRNSIPPTQSYGFRCAKHHSTMLNQHTSWHHQCRRDEIWSPRQAPQVSIRDERSVFTWNKLVSADMGTTKHLFATYCSIFHVKCFCKHSAGKIFGFNKLIVRHNRKRPLFRDERNRGRLCRLKLV